MVIKKIMIIIYKIIIKTNNKFLNGTTRKHFVYLIYLNVVKSKSLVDRKIERKTI